MNEDCQDLFLRLTERIEALENDVAALWSHIDYWEQKIENQRTYIRHIQRRIEEAEYND